jgi:hypothetical protein
MYSSVLVIGSSSIGGLGKPLLRIREGYSICGIFLPLRVVTAKIPKLA